ncbi:hypothetical protein [Methylobacterium komagatae]
MSNADVMRGQSLSNDLLRWETRGPGDTANAMRRIASRAAVPFGKLWALRYRPPKEIASHVLARIEAAHAAERERQLRRLAHDVEITAALAGPDHPAVAAAAAALRAAGGSAEGAAPRVVGAARQSARTTRAAREVELTDLPLWRAANEEE